MKHTSKYESPWASSDKLHIIDTGTWRYQRPVVKTSKCAQCGTCHLFCPVDCIKDRDTYFSADMDYCKGCGICAAICPVNAIVMVREN